MSVDTAMDIDARAPAAVENPQEEQGAEKVVSVEQG